MSDAWDEIQAIKSKRNSLRERLEKRKKERQDILGGSSNGGNCAIIPSSVSPSSSTKTSIKTTYKTSTGAVTKAASADVAAAGVITTTATTVPNTEIKIRPNEIFTTIENGKMYFT